MGERHGGLALLEGAQDLLVVTGVGAGEAEDDGHLSVDGRAEPVDRRRRVAGEGDPADHVDDEGIQIAAHAANHLEGGGDLGLAEVLLQIDHPGDADEARELIDRIGRHPGAVRDDEDPAPLCRHGHSERRSGVEERDAEVVALAPEHQRAPVLSALAGEEGVGERLVLEAGLGDAMVELAEERGLDARQLFQGHSPDRFRRPNLVFLR